MLWFSRGFLLRIRGYLFSLICFVVFISNYVFEVKCVCIEYLFDRIGMVMYYRVIVSIKWVVLDRVFGSIYLVWF